MKLDFWSELDGSRSFADVMVDPLFKEKFESLLKSEKIDYKTKIKDVSKLIENTTNQNVRNKKSRNLNDQFDFGVYHTLDEIVNWMYDFQFKYSNHVQLINVSRSFENRSITAMRISSNLNQTKPSIWMDGCIHSREWIAAATLIYMANEVFLIFLLLYS
jgi:hypothetical protein